MSTRSFLPLIGAGTDIENARKIIIISENLIDSNGDKKWVIKAKRN